MAFKVVLVSNFDDPMVADKLLNQTKYQAREDAQSAADLYNNDPKNGGEYRTYYASVKHADYVLYEFQP